MGFCVPGEEPEERYLLQKSDLLAGQKAWKETLSVRLELPLRVLLGLRDWQGQILKSLEELFFFSFNESYFPLSY